MRRLPVLAFALLCCCGGDSEPPDASGDATVGGSEASTSGEDETTTATATGSTSGNPATSSTDDGGSGDTTGETPTTGSSESGDGSSEGSETGDSGGATPECDDSPGAAEDAPVLGPTEYTGSGTMTITNVIFDGDHVDDLVRVNNGHVIFEHVTFRGNGTGPTGHSLEIKVGGSAEVRNSVFEGNPTEDSLQTQNNEATLVVCNVFASTPGEDHLDLKPGGPVTIQANDFTTASGRTVLNHNGEAAVDVIGNTGLRNVFFEDGATGRVVDNDFDGDLWLYDAVDVLVEGNTIEIVKHGEGSSDRDPAETYFLNNVIADAQDNGGTCYRDGNSGADPVPFCTAGPPQWYGER